MFTISALITAVSVLVSAIKILLNPNTYFFGGMQPALEPMTSKEEEQFDLMKWNPETESYIIKK